MKTRALFLTILFASCGTNNVGSQMSAEQQADQQAAAEEQDACFAGKPNPHACDSPKKTAICHVPPGNPANAHTICVGNPAVGPHQSHHDDYIGPCKCPEGSPEQPEPESCIDCSSNNNKTKMPTDGTTPTGDGTSGGGTPGNGTSGTTSPSGTGSTGTGSTGTGSTGTGENIF